MGATEILYDDDDDDDENLISESMSHATSTDDILPAYMHTCMFTPLHL